MCLERSLSVPSLNFSLPGYHLTPQAAPAFSSQKTAVTLSSSATEGNCQQGLPHQSPAPARWLLVGLSLIPLTHSGGSSLCLQRSGFSLSLSPDFWLCIFHVESFLIAVFKLIHLSWAVSNLLLIWASIIFVSDRFFTSKLHFESLTTFLNIWMIFIETQYSCLLILLVTSPPGLFWMITLSP